MLAAQIAVLILQEVVAVEDLIGNYLCLRPLIHLYMRYKVYSAIYFAFGCCVHCYSHIGVMQQLDSKTIQKEKMFVLVSV